MLSADAIHKTGKTKLQADTLESMVGKEVGLSDWVVLDQARIDAFADITLDPYFIHTDPAKAKTDTPFGGTIASPGGGSDRAPEYATDSAFRVELRRAVSSPRTRAGICRAVDGLTVTVEHAR